MGCPPLRSEAYSGARLEEQLEDQGRTFLRGSPAKNRVELATRSVYVSQVFKFRDYAKDFGGSREAVARFIARWYGPARGRCLEDVRVHRLRLDPQQRGAGGPPRRRPALGRGLGRGPA